METAEKARKPIYKKLLIIPAIVLLLSIGFLVNNFVQTGEWIERGIELKGGTVLEIKAPEIDTKALEEKLYSKFGQTIVTDLNGIYGHQISIQMASGVDIESVISEVESFGINTEGHTIKSIGSSLGASFWYQVQIGIALAFILMGLVVFVIFRTFVPSMAVMLAAISDIVITLAIMQFVGIPLTLASFAAILMLIGYSVDTDMLLTTRVLRSQDNMQERIMSGLKTGLTMTFTSIVAMAVLFIANINPVLSQIASVLVIGLVIDIMNTWIQNAGIIRWYAERKGI